VTTFGVGIVMPVDQWGPERAVPGWTELRAFALRAEAVGFDTIWTPDELLWRATDGPPRGFWDGVSVSAAVAAITSKVAVGTWVLSALHRNPGIIAKTAETLDEISGGRFVFGLGAGHEWPGQAHAFGLPEDRIFARFEEALAIIVPLLRDGHADLQGTYHAAHDLTQAPRGPRPGRIPLLIGGNGPKAQRHAVRHADTWSAYVVDEATVAEVGPRIASLEAIAAQEGRDPATIGRSIGVNVAPFLPPDQRPNVLSGSPGGIAAGLLAFREAGYTRAELMVEPGSVDALEALAPVLGIVRA
jgi:alkanesulfonate monooxygenase SsuD/methylene tetrahydromethanopterin reductase-like flavin-dependent oxidoreductase (luciferase family)